MKQMFKSSTNPINAPMPIQYQYACGKNPRDFKTAIPSVSVEFARTLKMNLTSDIRDKPKQKDIKWVCKRIYFAPTFPKKLINFYCVLRIHQGWYPIAPYQPLFYILCNQLRKIEIRKHHGSCNQFWEKQ